MKKIAIAVLLLGQMILPITASADDKVARSIMENVDARDDGVTMITDMEMVLIDRHGSKRARTLQTYSKDIGADIHKLMFFTHPADVKGTGFLTYDYEDVARDDDQWLYLPALKKTKRIASSDKSGSFMGSDFSYADMTSRDLEDYDFKLLKDSEVRGKKVWIIESIPRTDLVIEETGYTKSIAFIQQDNYLMVRALHYLENGGKRKYFDVQKSETINGVWVNLEMSMTTKQGKQTLHKTTLRNSKVEINTTLDDSMFTIRRLEKGL